MKNHPQTAEVGFLKTELRKLSFQFLNFEVGSVFRKPISDIFNGFGTPLSSILQLCIHSTEAIIYSAVRGFSSSDESAAFCDHVMLKFFFIS